MTKYFKKPRKTYFNPRLGPRFFVGYTFLATCKKSERQRDRDRRMTHFTEVRISQNYHTTLRSNKRGRDNHC